MIINLISIYIISAGFDPTQSPNSLMNSRPYGIAPPKVDDPTVERPYTYSPLNTTNPLEQAQSGMQSECRSYCV